MWLLIFGITTVILSESQNRVMRLEGPSGESSALNATKSGSPYFSIFKIYFIWYCIEVCCSQFSLFCPSFLDMIKANNCHIPS